MKILPYNGYRFTGTPISPINNKTEHDKTNKNIDKKQVGTITAVGVPVLASSIYFIATRGKKLPKNVAEEVAQITPAQLATFQKQMELFPTDIEYRKLLLQGLNIDIKNTALLRPIIGPEEFRSIIKTFNDIPQAYTPGKSLITTVEDGYDLSGVENGLFRANLHMHTTHSDGKLSVKEFLEQGVEYANKVFEKFKNDTPAQHAPFTMAITDHDSVEGCKEAVRIISENPYKYRNLRLVLGCEMTVEDKLIPQKLKTPVPIHMLVHGINPFDKNLEAFLEKTKVARVEAVDKMLAKARTLLGTEFPKTAEKLSYEDAIPLYPALKNRVTHMDYCTKDYLQFRTIFTECFENNPQISKLLEEKNIQSNYITPKDKFFAQIGNNYGNRDQYWRKYLLALQKYTAETLNISEEEATKFITVSPELENKLNELAQITELAKPKLELSAEFNDIAEAIDLIKSQPQGFVTIAHPALTGIGDCLENPQESMKAMQDLFKTFKQHAGNRALGAEIHYHYFGEVGSSTEWLNSIKQYAKEAGLSNTGGIDTHGTNIFYSSKDL